MRLFLGTLSSKAQHSRPQELGAVAVKVPQEEAVQKAVAEQALDQWTLDQEEVLVDLEPTEVTLT